jgi:aryl-alcohol dehydrogenase-like predicted oxidoreductase
MAGCGDSTKPEPVGPDVMPTRPFGATGFNVGIFSLGGQAALETPGQEDLAADIITRALDLGVNYIDTSAYYGTHLGQPGLSERNIGQAIAGRRDDVFITTKTLGRSRNDALADLDRSLENLQTDHIDLWLCHNVRTTGDVNNILWERGAYVALEQAKSEGKVRFIGVSGHYNPQVIKSILTQRQFDAVLMAVNAADVHYRSFVNIALPEAVDQGLGVVAMKIPARGRLFQEGGIETMEQAYRYVLSQPVHTAIIGCSSVEEVEENVQLAKDFTPYTPEEITALEDLTASYHSEGAWFKYEW